ncbi:hypothetical protein FJT64_023396 [Amphibalanus amphitrite]|uniref:Uncharacterized protein n=1 Tax=Amphibalanus amphitrite TaxID=1232801 RepID=A0A6A4WDW7_AMPAM|nr:hypothetical protein FJT64_023396 [Amphibalanus amphitrite]
MQWFSPLFLAVLLLSLLAAASGARADRDVSVQDDPEAVPAFPTSDQQFEFLMKLPMPYPYQWLSINDIQEERVYKDIFNETVVNIEHLDYSIWKAVSQPLA